MLPQRAVSIATARRCLNACRAPPRKYVCWCGGAEKPAGSKIAIVNNMASHARGAAVHHMLRECANRFAVAMLNAR